MKRYLELLMKNRYILLLLLAGAALLLLPAGGADTSGSGATEEERRLEDVLSTVEGVGQVGALYSESGGGGSVRGRGLRGGEAARDGGRGGLHRLRQRPNNGAENEN